MMRLKNGIEALSMLRSNKYDLLITDLYMPNLDGQQLLSKVRHDDNLHDLPVLMMSSEDDKEKIINLIKEQVTAFMRKPFNINTLEKQLNWIINESPIAIN